MDYLHSELTAKIIGAAIKVHKELGPGYPEKIYQRSLLEEFRKQELNCKREDTFRVLYEGKDVGFEVVDFKVEEKVIVELKSVREIMDVHKKQVIG